MVSNMDPISPRRFFVRLKNPLSIGVKNFWILLFIPRVMVVRGKLLKYIHLLEISNSIKPEGLFMLLCCGAPFERIQHIHAVSMHSVFVHSISQLQHPLFEVKTVLLNNI
jgi:hypothetical protein